MKKFVLPVLLFIMVLVSCEATESKDALFVKIEPGTYFIGSDETEEDRESNERKMQVVIKQVYWMSTTEVTQAQWKDVMGTNPSSFKDDQKPVQRVTWEEAVNYCKKLSALKNKYYRLPTEAEWEWACRERSQNFNNAGASERAWTIEKLPQEGVCRVGLLKPNALGLYDMQGNVMEWCADAYDDRNGCVDKGARVVKGGASMWSLSSARPAARVGYRATQFRSPLVGFRVVCESDPSEVKTEQVFSPGKRR